jgi:vacuolar-type H+-ATPase subunit I/STV1
MGEAMSPRTVFLARLIGLYCILAALSMFLRGQSTVDTVTLLLRDAPLMFVLGVVTLSAGLAMVLVHNLWSGGALAVIVTLVGWATLIKGLLFLILTPEAETALFLKGLHYQELFYLYAAVSLAVGVYLTNGGFRKSSLRS